MAGVSGPAKQQDPPIVRVDGLSKTYGSGEKAVQAIADLTFDVRAGEVACIVGPSGAGKTTFLKCVSGLMPPSGGDLELEGQPIDGPPARMALVFQEYGRSLMPWLNVEKNVTLPLRSKGMAKDEIHRRAADTLEAVGLAHAHRRYPWQLSGGMQQRVAIARALAYRPHVLLMDEPFASVDAQTRMDLEDLVLSIREEFKITIIFVTHDIDESIYLGDRVIVLSKSPTRVREIINVDIPNPRDQVSTKSLPRFGEVRRELLTLLGREVADDVPESADDAVSGAPATSGEAG
jgi:NitT/TauT family transport system ATP-binding protein